MLLCDTDVLIDFLRGNAGATAFLEARIDERLAVSALTVAELMAGARDSEKPAIGDLLRVFDVIPVDARIAAQGGALRRQYRDSHGTGLADAIIAATALAHGARLATRNVRHFPMIPDLTPAYEP